MISRWGFSFQTNRSRSRRVSGTAVHSSRICLRKQGPREVWNRVNEKQFFLLVGSSTVKMLARLYVKINIEHQKKPIRFLVFSSLIVASIPGCPLWTCWRYSLRKVCWTTTLGPPWSTTSPSLIGKYRCASRGTILDFAGQLLEMKWVTFCYAGSARVYFWSSAIRAG